MSDGMIDRNAAFRRSLVIDGVVDVRVVSDLTGSARLPAAHQEDEDFLQAPPAEDYEVLLQHQSKSGRQRFETTGAEDRVVKKSVAGDS